MLYPKCPKCGGTTASAESGDVDGAIGRTGLMLHRAANSHPYLKAAHFAISLGRQIYKRVPGGGEKQCTVCGHHFR